jgi:hypothetical protein
MRGCEGIDLRGYLGERLRESANDGAGTAGNSRELQGLGTVEAGVGANLADLVRVDL